MRCTLLGLTTQAALVVLFLAACSTDSPGPQPTATPEASLAASPIPRPRAATPTPGLSDSVPFATDPVPSPDGSLHAYVEFRFARCPDGCFVIFEDDDGEELGRVPFTHPDLVGMAASWPAFNIDAWLEDGTGVVLGGSCECDAPGPLPVVLVMTDGSVVNRDTSGQMLGSGPYVAPNGRYFLAMGPHVESWERDDGSCSLRGEAEIVDLLTGDVVATIGEDRFVLVDWRWADDGRRLAYALRELPDADEGPCSKQRKAWEQIPEEPRRLELPAPERTTHITELNSVIDAIEAADVAAIRDLLRFQSLPCAAEAGMRGAPKCRDNEPDGTRVNVFAYSGCEPDWLRDDQMLAVAIESLVDLAPQLLAAFIAPRGVYRSNAEYVVLFAGLRPQGDYERGVLVLVRDGGIVEIIPDCGAGNDPLAMIPDGVDRFLIPLRVPGTSAGTPTSSTGATYGDLFAYCGAAGTVDRANARAVEASIPGRFARPSRRRSRSKTG